MPFSSALGTRPDERCLDAGLGEPAAEGDVEQPQRRVLLAAARAGRPGARRCGPTSGSIRSRPRRPRRRRSRPSRSGSPRPRPPRRCTRRGSRSASCGRRRSRVWGSTVVPPSCEKCWRRIGSLDDDAVGHVEEVAAGEEGRVQRGEPVAVRRGQREEQRLDQLGVRLGGDRERLEDHARRQVWAAPACGRWRARASRTWRGRARSTSVRRHSSSVRLGIGSRSYAANAVRRRSRSQSGSPWPVFSRVSA